MKLFSLFFICVILLISFSSCQKSTTDTSNVVPTAPTTLIATNESSSSILLTWTDNSTNETGFKIERKTSTSNYSLIGTVSKDITKFKDSNLTTAASFTYRVYAFNSSGSSLTYTNEATSNNLNYLDLNSGLIAYYNFNGNTNDSTSNQNDQIEYRSPTYVDDRRSNSKSAINFSNKSYILSSKLFYKSSVDHALSFWFKPNTTAIAALYNTSPHGIECINFNYNKAASLSFFLGDGVKWSVATDQLIDIPISQQKWYHLVVNFSSNLTNPTKPNTWDYYLNGKLVFSYTTNKLTSSDFVKLGFGTWFTYDQQDANYTGSIDDVRVYNKSLNISQIEYLANN